MKKNAIQKVQSLAGWEEMQAIFYERVPWGALSVRLGFFLAAAAAAAAAVDYAAAAVDNAAAAVDNAAAAVDNAPFAADNAPFAAAPFAAAPFAAEQYAKREQDFHSVSRGLAASQCFYFDY